MHSIIDNFDLSIRNIEIPRDSINFYCFVFYNETKDPENGAQRHTVHGGKGKSDAMKLGRIVLAFPETAQYNKAKAKRGGRFVSNCRSHRCENDAHAVMRWAGMAKSINLKENIKIMEQKEFKSKPSKQFVVTQTSGLLEFLLRSLTNQSRNHVKSLLTHRLVSVDGVIKTKHDTELKEGQVVCIHRPVIQARTQEGLDILYEDKDLIVINKPSGLLSIASDQEKEATAYHMLTDYVKLKNARNRIFAVHRLDRETSGILLAAKNEKMKFALQDHWADLVSDRAYIAVVEGHLAEKSGKVQSWLKETKTLLMYSSARDGDGLEAITSYTVLKETAGYSLLDVHLETGRKNQIRVHMKDLGHSVVGDKKYGATTDPLKRMGLHAYKLELKHPFSGELMCFEARPPQSFAALFHAPKHNKKTKKNG